MKRYGILIVFMVLALTACGAPQTDTAVETGTQAEEERTQSENQAQVVETESGQTEVSNETEKQAEIPQVDLHDEGALGDFFYEHYLDTVEKDLQQDKAFVKGNLVFQYADFNNDGELDVVCYSEEPSYAFSEFLFVTIEENAYQTIETSISPVFAYEQSFGKEGEFVVHKFSGGGTGIRQTIVELCHMAYGKIEYTGTSLVLDGYLSIPAMENNPNGVNETYSSEIFDMSYKVGSDLDKWLLFKYKYTEVDDLSGEILYEKEEQYTYNADTNTYYIDLLSEMAKAGSKGTSEKTEEGVYAIKRIEAGQILEGFDVEEAYYVDQDRAGFKLTGSVEIEGTILVDEMTDEYVFSATEPLLSSPIRISVDGFDFDFDRPAGAYFDVSVLDKLKEVQRQYLKDQGSLDVRLTIDSFACGIKFDSEGGQGIHITSIESLEEIDAHYGDSEYIESVETEKIQGFEPETFTTSKQGAFAIDYSNYRLVVLPMFDTVNDQTLGTASAVFEGDYINAMKFSVLGRLEDVKINNYDTYGEEGKWIYLGDVENAVVTIKANLPGDMSGVKVYGKFYDGEGTYSDVEFTLDDMRPVSEYEILMFE